MHRNAVIDNPNVLPISVSRAKRTIFWRDVGECPFTHSFYHWSIEDWERQHGVGATYETDLPFLATLDLAGQTVEPTAFIFHMSRCGSSLVSRALGQNPRVIVMSEVPALNEMLDFCCDFPRTASAGDDAKHRTLRNFVRLLGRRRRTEQGDFVVKFSSWNVIFVEVIHALFPRVPCVFVYREPAEVMVSLVRGPSAYVARPGCYRSQMMTGRQPIELKAMGQAEYIGHCLHGILAAAVSAPYMRYLNYRDLRKPALPALLRALHLDCADRELPDMAAAFDLDAKALSADVRFVDDTADKQRGITEEIRAVSTQLLDASYAAMERSERRLHLQPDEEAT